jgi:hypothetical protein
MPTLQGLQPRNTKKLPKGGAIALIVCITVLCLVIIAIGTYFDRKRAQRRRQAIRDDRLHAAHDPPPSQGPIMDA